MKNCIVLSNFSLLHFVLCTNAKLEFLQKYVLTFFCNNSKLQPSAMQCFECFHLIYKTKL